MSAHRTSRLGITGYDPTGSDLLSNIATIGNTFLDQLDAATTGYSSGVIASRPTVGTAGRVYLATDDRTSSPNGTLYFDNGTAWVIVPSNNYAAGLLGSRSRTGTRGQFYYATDDTTAGANGTLYLFDGTGWVQVQTGAATALSSTITSSLGLTDGVAVRRGKSIIATAETHTTGTSYGLLPTPDRVQNVVVPAGALVLVWFQAIWKTSNSGGPGRAALFLGANQLKVQRFGASAPATQAGATDPTDFSNTYAVLTSFGQGLMSFENTGSAAGDDVTTGQATGVVGSNSNTNSEEVGGSIFQPPEGNIGGPITVDNLAAGTYDFSVQFKATAGTVTVRNRRLRVWVLGF